MEVVLFNMNIIELLDEFWEWLKDELGTPMLP